MSTGTRRRGGKPKVRLAGSRRLVCAPKLPRESVVTIRSPADVAPIACRQPPGGLEDLDSRQLILNLTVACGFVSALVQ